MNEPIPAPPLPIMGYAAQPLWARDEDHLRLLAIFHFIYGGLTMLFSCFTLFYIVLGIALVNNPALLNGRRGVSAGPGGPPPALMGWVFIIIGSVGFLVGWAVGIMSILSGRDMQKRRRKMFSLIIAGINCIFVPLGTILAVFTFVVLLRQSMEMLYRRPTDR